MLVPNAQMGILTGAVPMHVQHIGSSKRRANAKDRKSMAFEPRPTAAVNRIRTIVCGSTLAG